jgi:class 3 adenylate cyclase
MVILAQEMLAAVEAINAEGDDEPVRIRIGVNSGPVIAGVIGQSKFAYDLWGDAVNVAARMEQAGAPGEVRLTEATRADLGDSVPTTDEGLVAVKGKGEMRVYSLRA